MDEVWKDFLAAQPRTVGDVIDTLNEEQLAMLYYLIGEAITQERQRIVNRILGIDG